MDKFFERHSRRDTSNSPLSTKEIEFVVKNLSTKKSLGPNNFLGEFYQTLKGEIISILYELLQKIEK